MGVSMRKFFVAVVGAIATFGAQPALADQPFAVTPNGRAEMMFDVPAMETADLLAGGCMNNNWAIKEQSPQHVLCEAPPTFGQSLLANLAMGNNYSTQPRLYYRFSIVQLSNETRVQANGWMGLQTAFGQNREMETYVKGFHNNAMDLMRSAGGRFPEGTAFPNHAYMGANLQYVEAPKKGLVVTEVEAGSPFEAAGFKVGDMLYRVAGERWKGYNDIYDGLHKAAAKTEYEVEFYPSGSNDRKKVMVARVFRATVGPLENPNPPFGSDDPSQTVVVQNEVSTADELAKFADLLSKGIITQEEFDAQKSKLLELN